MTVAFGIAILAASLVQAWDIPTYPNLTSCASSVSTYSCENTTAIENTCCSPTPGGLTLLTQFWDTYTTGMGHEGQLLPEGSWTIHGLWPDNCDGSYQQYCDFSRQYDPNPSPSVLPNGTVVPPWKGPSIVTFIEEFKRQDILHFANNFWINQGGNNSDLWAHEFSKHATCISTFDVKCYSNYKEHEDVVNFFDTVINHFFEFPTFNMLAAYGIVPSNTTKYSLNAMQDALKAQTGAIPYLGCVQNGTVLSEVWYYGHVYGSVQYGQFKTLDSTTQSTCSNATGAIYYYERSPKSEGKVRWY